MLITDPENIGTDTISVTVSCILSTILNKIDFSIMEALICIYKKIPKVNGVITQLEFINDKSTIKPYTIENS